MLTAALPIAATYVIGILSGALAVLAFQHLRDEPAEHGRHRASPAEADELRRLASADPHTAQMETLTTAPVNSLIWPIDEANWRLLTERSAATYAAAQLPRPAGKHYEHPGRARVVSRIPLRRMPTDMWIPEPIDDDLPPYDPIGAGPLPPPGDRPPPVDPPPFGSRLVNTDDTQVIPR